MKLRSKILMIMLLAVLIVLLMIPATASAAEKVASGECGKDGDNLTWVLDSDGTLTISGEGEMMDDFDPEYNGYDYELLNQIKSIVFEDGVTSIGAFSCNNLESVSLPSTLSSIGRYAFSPRYYGNLKSIIIPENVKFIGAMAFYRSGLESIYFKGDFPEFEKVDENFFDEWDLNYKSYTSFYGVTAEARYPIYNDTWSKSALLSYGGNLTWIGEGTLNNPKIEIATISSTGKPQVKWDAVNGAAKFEVYRATSKSGTYTRLITTTKTSVTNTSAVAGKTYYYKVRAVDASGKKSKFSPIKSITCDCAKPVVTLTIKSSSGKPNLTWEAVEGALKYEVWYATSKSGTYKRLITTTKTSVTNTSAVAGKTYYYKVKAICGTTTNGNSAYSAVKYVTCDCAKPVVTLSVKADSGKPYLKWKAVEGAAKYEVWRATSKTGTYKRLITTTKTSVTNTSAVAGKTYYYKVKAISSTKSAANSAYSAVKYVTCDCAKPVVSITRNSSGKPKLTWKAVSGASKYEVWRATSKSGTYKKVYTTSKTSYTNTSATAGKTYYYKVKAICKTKSAGNSAYSSVKYIKAK